MAIEKIFFQTGDLEGPLDLILKLITKHKLDIYDIQINELVNQYMEAINNLDLPKMESASEFLEMASRLVYIKTVSLLPKHEKESIKLKEELEGQLIEYQTCKIAAQLLGTKFLEDNPNVRNYKIYIPNSEIVDNNYKYDINKLKKAYLIVVDKKFQISKPMTKFEPIVKEHILSIRTAMVKVIRKFYNKDKVSIFDLLEDIYDVSSIVVMFLATLELIKSGKLKIYDNNNEIYIKLKR